MMMGSDSDKQATDPEAASNAGQDTSASQQGSEFVILLDEPTEKSEPETAAATEDSGQQLKSGEFIILLDEEGDSESTAEGKTNESARLLDLGHESTINNVSELHQKILELVKSQEPIVIDASQIDTIDTAVTQLLCLMVKEAESKEIPLDWKTPSDRFMTIASRLDLVNPLNIASASPG